MAHFKEAHGPQARRETAPLLRITPPKVDAPPYAELACATNFSFLRGASHGAELVERAAALGLRALAITDWHTLAGMVRAHGAAKDVGLKIIVGAHIEPHDGPALNLLCADRRGYANLCRLLTVGKRRAPKGECELYMADVAEFAAGLMAIALCPHDADAAMLGRAKTVFGPRLSLAIWRHLERDDDLRLHGWNQLSQQSQVPCVAVNDVHMHERERKPLQDVLTCVRHGVSIDHAAGLLLPNAERRIKSPAEMYALFSENTAALERSSEIADACTFSLDELRYEYPDEVVPVGMTMSEYLKQQTWEGARLRYGTRIAPRVRELLEKELELIEELSYEPYFLTVHDIVRFARSRNILCQGRGSAANSAVCYCLGVTAVDPLHFDLLFERFVSRERAEPPDIDIDFEHERREEVIQYVYAKYGRDHAGMCATVISYRSKSAIRDVGKALGLSLDQVDSLSKARQWFDGPGVSEERLRETGIDARDKRVKLALQLARELYGFPRHLSQHVGGLVMTRGRLDELVPIENAAMKDRTVIEWDKDDIDELGILKVDCLSLGMLTAVHKAFDLVKQHGGEELSVDAVMATEPPAGNQTPRCTAVYAMLQQADAVGTFQVESRAQLSMLPRLKPREFFDLVVEVAIVRPGPIQGGMVHPYLRRRAGEEPADIPYEPLRPFLGRTFGVPIFQEQAMNIAVVAAHFTPGEADQLRKAMGAWRRPGIIDKYINKLLEGMKHNGIAEDYAQQLLKQIRGFGEYGFPQSHAASFAIITYVSSFLKRFYPAALTAALINAQPMGFYSVSSLVRDAREHGVHVLPVDVNSSDWDCTLEQNAPYAAANLDDPPELWGKGPALRLGMRQVRGLREEVARAIVAERGLGFSTLNELEVRMAKAGVPLGDALARLSRADAFASLGVSRRDALWKVRGMKSEIPEMFIDAQPKDPGVALPAMSEQQSMVADYNNTGLSLKRHPMEFWRDQLTARGVLTGKALLELNDGARVAVAGRVTTRQRPGKGTIIFVTLEDETAIMNLMMKPEVFEKHRQAAMSSMLIARGKLQKRHGVIHVMVSRVEALNERQTELKLESRDFH
ncbi:MAG: error-prone DNA polymerase [Planctomycetes bacterium]|nr:error-prone DNA polymerase [Planctomycetota bacterium]